MLTHLGQTNEAATATTKTPKTFTIFFTRPSVCPKVSDRKQLREAQLAPFELQVRSS
jgi:hypothetical protein